MTTTRKTPRPKDRVVDHTEEFTRRLRLHERYNSPRQCRLRKEREATVAQFHQCFKSIVGGVLLIIVVLLFAFA
jgi:hypothetical protein